MKVSSGILNVFNKSLSWKGEKNQTLTSQPLQNSFDLGLKKTGVFFNLIQWRKRVFSSFSFWIEENITWNIVYIITVSGRFPENSEILKTLRPHLFACSSSFTRKNEKQNHQTPCHVQDVCNSVCDRTGSHKPSLTHPRSPSWHRNEGYWSWWGWRSVEAFSPRWSETWACSSSPSPSVSGGTASRPHAACLGWRNEAYFSSCFF